MKDNSFIDTNILIYSYSSTEPAKRNKAIEIINSQNSFISTQVLSEFVNIISRKFGLEWDQIIAALDEVVENYTLSINNSQTIKAACQIASKYRYSYYDSLIIAAALENGCKMLYSEDFQHNQLIENKLRIINPFIE